MPAVKFSFVSSFSVSAALRTATAVSFVLLTVLLVPDALYAQYYKCIGEDGVHIYTNTGCPIDAENQRFALPDSENQDKVEVKTPGTGKQAGDYPYNGYDNAGSVGLEIYTEGYRLSPEERSQIETGVDFILGYYKQAFNYNEEVPVKIRIFGNKRRFMSYQKDFSPVVSDAGFYSAAHNEAVVNGERDKAEVIATIYHEANHAILIQKAPELPLWINEGLAEYFERLVPEGGSVTVGHQDGRYYKVQKELKSKELPALSDYLSASDSAWERGVIDRNEQNRSIAWSLVHYMMSTQEGQETVIYILREKNNDPSVSSVEIIDKYYPGGMEKLESGWKDHISKSPTLHVYAPFD